MTDATLIANTLKGLAIDGVEAANSGHPGMPLGMADAATVLWTRFLKFDPDAPQWPDRDRFVLSAGHGSMLLYGLLHLSGFDLPLSELRRFRQWGSKTPGHPEHGHTVGVETTTGPLGQGFANGVGMAIAERLFRETFGADVCDHRVYGIVGDGDLMEGISYEAASLAGHLRLGRLIYLYDSNRISIDGSTQLAFTEDTAGRFEAAHWHVTHCDGHDPEDVARAIAEAVAVDDKPSLVICRTIIGHGSKNEGSEKTHGAPLGAADVAAVKVKLGLDPEKSFDVPEAAYAAFRHHGGPAARKAWEARFAAHPRAAEFTTWTSGRVDDVAWPTFPVGTKLATRKASQAALKAITAAAPWVVGGSADLAGSNGTDIGRPLFTPSTFAGAGTFAFGVREHAMAAICNGLALSGLRPYCATFLVFHDYQRPSVRLASLMQQPVVYVYTHDSVFLGEDGPTHQPIETVLALRALPGVSVWRPADAVETVEAWRAAIARTDGPTALVLTRQNLPVQDRAGLDIQAAIARGAYTLVDAENPQVVIVATGSEVALAVDAAAAMADVRVRVVSMPNRERFLAQDAAYRASVLPAGVRRLAIEAGATLGWERIVGDSGDVLGIDHFGASAPDHVLAEKFGFTVANVVAKARALIG